MVVAAVVAVVVVIFRSTNVWLWAGGDWLAPACGCMGREVKGVKEL